MGENAWPFLIGRAKEAGYRVVVVPDFMADAAAVDALSAAARDVRLPDDTACVRELRGLVGGPVTIVYRSYSPRAEDYGLGEGALSDGFGRPIRVTEGIVLRSAATSRLPEISVADLDHAHATVTDAYRQFWHQERAFERRTSAGCPLGAGGRGGGSEAQLVRLEVAEPWTQVRVEVGVEVGVRDVVAQARPLSPSSPSQSRSPSQSQSRSQLQPQPQRERRSRRTVTGVVAGAAVVVAGLMLYSGVLRGKPPSPAASVLDDLCHALKAGKLDMAYGYTSPQLRSTVSPADFAKELLASAPRAKTCTPTVSSLSKSGALGTVTLTTDSAPPIGWNVTLVPGEGRTWVISGLFRG